MLLGGNAGLAYYIAEVTKEAHVDANSSLVSGDGASAVATASAVDRQMGSIADLLASWSQGSAPALRAGLCAAPHALHAPCTVSGPNRRLSGNSAELPRPRLARRGPQLLKRRL